MKPSDLSAINAVDEEGRTFAALPTSHVFNSTTFIPDNDFTLALLVAFDKYPPTSDHVIAQLSNPGGSARRRLRLYNDTLGFEEIDNVGASSTIRSGAQNRIIPKLGKLYLIIIANSGNKNYLYVAPSDSSLAEVDCVYAGSSKTITNFYLQGGFKFYRAIGFNSFIYNLTSIVDAFSETYKLNTRVLQNNNMPVLDHEWHFTNDTTQYDMINSVNMTRNGSFSRVSSQFQGADQAVSGTGYFTANISPAITSNFALGLRFRMPTSISTSRVLIDLSSILVAINTSRQLELYAGGSSFINTVYPLELGAVGESEVGWYQVFLHRVGNTVSLFPEFEPGGSVTTASVSSITSMSIGANLSGAQALNGRLSWCFLKRGTLSAAQKSALSSMTAPNMGTTTAHGRPILGMIK